MGAWSAWSFDNDDAMDWVAELEGSEDDSAVVTALKRITDLPAEDYLELPEAASAVAAAEVVACLKAARPSNLPPEVEEWIDNHGSIKTEELAPLALRALARVKTNSELKELWDESDESGEWHNAIAELEARLRD